LEQEKLKQEQLVEEQKIQEYDREKLKKMGIKLVGKKGECKRSRHKMHAKTIPIGSMTPIKYEAKENVSPMDYSERKVRHVVAPIRSTPHVERIKMNIANIINEIYVQNMQLTKELNRIKANNLYKSHRKSYHPHSFNEFRKRIEERSVTSESTNEDIKSTSIFIPIKY